MSLQPPAKGIGVCGERGGLRGGGFCGLLTTAELPLLQSISYEPVLPAGLFAVAVCCADCCDLQIRASRFLGKRF
ncbi:jg20472 [Pararge aegeria aegeria]|uniref:Jg20472 protein n=1 Tax=Pararge aegeria aegeria TaxID=348720 RepID=A0A8S4RSM2_9NEOP|nr:jg20472 [Pararge aegeria aegeria]